MSELKEIARRFATIDVALLPVNGLQIRPLFNRKLVMDDRDAAELCAVLRPRFAIPIHYAFRAGAVGDHLLLKYTGTASGFARFAASIAPDTIVMILAPGGSLQVDLRRG